MYPLGGNPELDAPLAPDVALGVGCLLKHLRDQLPLLGYRDAGYGKFLHYRQGFAYGRFRAEGEREAARIRADTDLEVARIRAEANEEAARIRDELKKLEEEEKKAEKEAGGAGGKS